MSKHFAVKFEKELRKLFDARTFWLRRAISKGGQGRPPLLMRKKVSIVIKKLQSIATDNLSYSYASKAFSQTIDQRRQWHVSTNKGWGWREKKKSFDDWFSASINFSNCIYIFWAKKKCIYVGRTIRGKGRAQNHFIKTWFNGVTRIDIYSTSLASQVPKLECLAIHRFRPRENGMKASIPKWAKKCPVCEVQKNIRSELHQIFSFKK